VHIVVVEMTTLNTPRLKTGHLKANSFHGLAVVDCNCKYQTDGTRSLNGFYPSQGDFDLVKNGTRAWLPFPGSGSSGCRHHATRLQSTSCLTPVNTEIFRSLSHPDGAPKVVVIDDFLYGCTRFIFMTFPVIPL
jgi:hypothetical protein